MVLADGLGTTRATVDSSQAVTSTFTTEAFGNTVAQWGSSANPYRFAGAWGYRDDGDMGLLYIGGRWYAPSVGRWASADKWLGNIYRPLSLSRYLYCEDDPVNAVDPSGSKWREIIVGLLCLISGEPLPEQPPVPPPPGKGAPAPKLPAPRGGAVPPPKLPPREGAFIEAGIVMRLAVIAAGAEAIYELFTYEPGKPTGPFPAIGQRIADRLFPIE